MQEIYNTQKQCLSQACANASREIASTSSKLSQNRVDLIEQRARSSRFRNDSERNNNEYREVDRNTKRAIEKDLRTHRTMITRNTIEKYKSTRKAKKQLYHSKWWILGIKVMYPREETEHMQQQICINVYTRVQSIGQY